MPCLPALLVSVVRVRRPLAFLRSLGFLSLVARGHPVELPVDNSNAYLPCIWPFDSREERICFAECFAIPHEMWSDPVALVAAKTIVKLR